jgi:hypothetical protein
MTNPQNIGAFEAWRNDQHWYQWGLEDEDQSMNRLINIAAETAWQAVSAAKDKEIAKLKAHLDWLVNAVLYCDYGDNQEPGEQIGWGVKYDLLDGKQFMFGDSVAQAIDKAIDQARGKQ